MRLRNFARRIAFATVLAAGLAVQPGWTQTVRVGGTGAGTVTLAALSEAIRVGSGVTLQTLPSLGSAGGMRALNDGKIDLAVLGRPMAPQEAQAGARVVAAMRTPFVLVTSENAAPSMKAGEIVAAYADPRARWPSGQPVALVLRQRSDGDALLLDAMFEGMAAAVALGRARPEVLVSVVDDDNAEIAERTKGSLATMSYSQLMIEQRRLRMVTVEGVTPSLEAFESGRYPHGRSFLLVLPSRPSTAALQVIEFLRGPEGVAALRSVHCLPGDAP